MPPKPLLPVAVVESVIKKPVLAGMPAGEPVKTDQSDPESLATPFPFLLHSLPLPSFSSLAGSWKVRKTGTYKRPGPPPGEHSQV